MKTTYQSANNGINVNLEIMRRLYDECYLTLVIGSILAILLTISISQTSTPPGRLYVWLAIILSIYLGRAILTARYQRANSVNLVWLARFRFSLLLTGLAWGSASFLLFSSGDVINQSILSFVLAGLSAGAAITYAIDLVALFGLLFPVTLSLLIRLLMEGTPSAFAMSGMVLLFLGFIAAYGRKAHGTLHENINLAASSAIGEKKERAYSQVFEMITQGAPLEKIMTAIALNLEQQMTGALCSILLLDPQGKQLLTGAAPNLPDFYTDAVHGIEIGQGAGSCGTAAFTGERFIVADIQNHPYWADYRDIAAKAGIGACWSEPVKGASGNVLGTFAIYHREPATPAENDIQLIAQYANLAGIAIERSRSNQQQMISALIFENSSEAMMVTDADNHLIAVNPAFTEITGFTPEEVLGKSPDILKSGLQNEMFYQEMWRQLNTSGNWQGELWNQRKNGQLWAEWIRINTIYDDNGAVLYRVSLASDITRKKESEETIWRQANFDSLTELPNRRLLHERLQQAIKNSHRSGHSFALIFLDLDRFKEVNDALGHGIGDLLLQQAAERLAICVRETDTVARLGGDEFTIILNNIVDHTNIERVVQLILQKISVPFMLGEETVYTSASIGVTLFPQDASDMDQLLKNADQAMYTAKQQGRNRFSYFTRSMQDTAQERMRLTSDLRSAMNSRQFHLAYQPIVDMKTGHICKAEALIRWQHPTMGMVSPARFIPVAEDTGMIVEIGNWVFQEAAQQAAQWRKSLCQDFQISINKSPVQFHANSGKAEAYAEWARYLERIGLSGQSLVVEITERLLLEASSTISDQLLEFRDAGIQVSLDDFGTGYSSLSYLKKFHIDYVKIDQSFVRNLEEHSDDMALCEAIIVMAHKLDMQVVAEGIETEQQFRLLKAAGCDYGQGYFFSRPVSAEEFEKLILK